MKLLRIISGDFDVIDQLLIRYSVFFRHWRNGAVKWGIRQLLTDFEKTCDSVGTEVL